MGIPRQETFVSQGRYKEAVGAGLIRREAGQGGPENKGSTLNTRQRREQKGRKGSPFPLCPFILLSVIRGGGSRGDCLTEPR